jgi:hypothetical protein
MLCNLVGSYYCSEGSVDFTFKVGVLEEIGCLKTELVIHLITVPYIPAGSNPLCIVICGSSYICRSCHMINRLLVC